MSKSVLSLLVGLAVISGGYAMAEGGKGLLAASGRVDITPTRPAYIAGYGSNRKSINGFQT